MERPIIEDFTYDPVRDKELLWRLNRYCDILERKIEVLEAKQKDLTEQTYCGCIDKCSSKRGLTCLAKRPCINKL